jgi:ribosome-binding protein aMBF1 (putative translation factor)
MMTYKRITLDGAEYYLVPVTEAEGGGSELPPLPEPDRNGNVPALAYARASMARKVVARREARGWSQAELARHAGIRVEVLNRIERAKTTPTETTMRKIEAALNRIVPGAKVGHASRSLYLGDEETAPRRARRSKSRSVSK